MSLKHLSANAPLKIISLVIAYGLWSLLNQMHATLLTTTVPLCFYNIPTHKTINAPEAVTITLSGKRNELARIDLSTLAAHINAKDLIPGPHNLSLTREHFFVPTSCNLVHYKPSNIMISVQEEKIVA